MHEERIDRILEDARKGYLTNEEVVHLMKGLKTTKRIPTRTASDDLDDMLAQDGYESTNTEDILQSLNDEWAKDLYIPQRGRERSSDLLRTGLILNDFDSRYNATPEGVKPREVNRGYSAGELPKIMSKYGGTHLQEKLGNTSLDRVKLPKLPPITEKQAFELAHKEFIKD
jgi:hypothetical protein